MSENIGTNNNIIKTQINIYSRRLHIYNHGVFISSQLMSLTTNYPKDTAK